MEHVTNISCPNCGQSIDVNEILYHQLNEKVKQENQSTLAEQQKIFEEKNRGLQKEKEELNKLKTTLEEEIASGVSSKLSLERSKIEKSLREQIAEEKDGEINSYKEQLQVKIEEAKGLNKMKAEFEKLQREKDELQEKIQADAERIINEKIKVEREKIHKELDERNQLKVSEKQHIIDQLQEQLKDAQRKAEQGSMQIQGEVQELAIEEFLKSNFQFDSIEEIKKGARGADCFQIIHTRERQNCGSIYYESKRTKDFQASWIEKFKNDMRQRNATFGILVTDVLPKDMERLGQRDGIWVCTFEEFKGLCFVLREAVIMLNTVAIAQENKGGKMELLYEYLIGSEFRMQIEAIVEGFTQMNEDLNSERRAMEGIWKKREKQLQKVILNTSQMYGSIRGIAGVAIQSISALELNESNV